MKKSEWSGGVVGAANFVPLQPKNENGISYLPIKYNFPMGTGESLNDDSALVRSLKGLLVDGKPIRKISFIFYKEKNDHYTVGTIILSEKYLIFYPALIPSKVTESLSDEKTIKDIPLNIDHLTLEENWVKWHFSFKQKKEQRKYKLITRKTKKINNSLTLWFVMAVKSLDKLEEMPKTQEYKLVYPNYDELLRRYSEFIEARKQVNFPIMEVKGEPENDWYLNLEFFIDKKISGDYRQDYPKTPTVYHANSFSSNKGNPIPKFYTRDIHVNLPGFEGRLWVRVSRMPGRLEKEGYFIPGSDYQ